MTLEQKKAIALARARRLRAGSTGSPSGQPAPVATSEAVDTTPLDVGSKAAVEAPPNVGQFMAKTVAPFALGAKQRIDALSEAATGKERSTAISKTFPDFATAIASPGLKMGDRAKMLNATLSASSPEERIKMISNIEGTQFEVDAKDNVIAILPNGQKTMVNKPGFSATDFGDVATKLAAFAMGSRRGGPSFKGQLGGAMVTQAGLEGLSYAQGGEFQPSEIGLATIGEAIGLGAFKAIGATMKALPKNQRASVSKWQDLEGKIPDSLFKKVKKAKTIEGKFDAPAFIRAQATGSTQDLGKLQTAAGLEKNALELAEAYSRQDSFIHESIKDTVGDIVGGSSLNDAITGVRNASVDVFDQLRTVRSNEADSLYSKVFKDASDVDLRGLKKEIDTIAKDASIDSGQKQRALEMVSRFMDTGTTGPQSGILKSVFPDSATGAKAGFMPAKLAQELKFELDTLLLKTKVTSSGANTEKALVSVKQKLATLIDEAAPGYKNANLAFANKTAFIEELEDDIIGLVSRKKDSQLESIVNIFNKKDVDSMLKLKGVLDSQGPDVYAKLYGAWMEDRLKSLPGDVLEKGNPAEVIWKKFFGDGRISEKTLRLAPDMNSRKNLVWLKKYSQLSMKARVHDLQRASAQAASDKAKGGVRSTVKGLGSETRKTMLHGAVGSGEKKRLSALFEAQVGPRWAEDMADIRKLGPFDPKTTAKLKTLIDKIVSSGQAVRSGTSTDDPADIEQLTNQ